MDTQTLTYLFVGLSFALYIGIAIASYASSTGEFYVAGRHVPPVLNGMATAADWMSASSFISMAGLIAFLGYDGSVYLMGWTGGYVVLALLLAPYLRRFGQYTVPDFIGERYYSKLARLVAVGCLLVVSLTYIAGQMRGVGIVFSRFLEVDINLGVLIGMAIVFLYAVVGGMKGITYTQVAQYCVLIFAYLVPAIFISLLITGNPVPQLGLGAPVNGESLSVLQKLDAVLKDLGFAPYTDGSKSTIDLLAITAALMVGTAGLPHVIVRFFTVPNMAAARKSAGFALVFIAILYTTAPAVAAFARLNFVETVNNTQYEATPAWLKNWEDIGLIAWVDKNQDGTIQYRPGAATENGAPVFIDERGPQDQRLIANPNPVTENEIYVDQDIMVLANPEIANLPGWVIALVAAGGLAAALSTAAGLLLVISSAISHDLLKKTLFGDLTERRELLSARLSAIVAVSLAGYFGINPPGFVSQVVAFAFGLAAASIFPALFLGVFTQGMNREGAIAGMVAGMATTWTYIAYFKFWAPQADIPANWFLGISPEGIGIVGMVINFAVALTVARITMPPPQRIRNLVDHIRSPLGGA